MFVQCNFTFYTRRVPHNRLFIIQLSQVLLKFTDKNVERPKTFLNNK